ncbi:Spc98 family-domain-containing protein [Scheffersomyces amazonensis]|uniref:Spc98 family-domain-containing protein n=1 Tax=Scheffersomyces amazonensis TaxID=1078765 RepID=UPI00315D4006
MTSFLSSQIGDLEPDIVSLLEVSKLVESCVHRSSGRTTRIRPQLLKDIEDLTIQQGLIIKDLLFVLLGYEGCYIRYSDKYNPSNSDSRIAGPDFKIAKHLDISLKSLSRRLLKYGKYYSGLTEFVQIYDKPRYGRVVQRLCYCVTQFLNYYQKVILELENEFKYNANFNLNLLETHMNQQVTIKLSHLYDIVNSIHDISQHRLSHIHDNNFDDFLSNVKRSLHEPGIIETYSNSGRFDVCKGGLVLKVLQDRINVYKGDFDSLDYLTELFDSISEDYVTMLNKWLSEGVIDDPFDEFLIREKPVPESLVELFNEKSEHFWNELFILRSDGTIQQFNGVDMQLKLLNTGKYLNIFKLCTGLSNFQSLNETLPTITKINSVDLELKINYFYNRANKLLMKLLFEGFYFQSLVHNLQSIFLFENSYNIDRFIDKSFNELKRDRYSISLSRIQKNYSETNNSICKFEIVDENLKTETSIIDILRQNQKLTVSSSNFYEVAKEIMNVQAFDADTVFQGDSDLQQILARSLENRRPVQSADSNRESIGYDLNHSDLYTISSIDLMVTLPFPLNLIISRELAYHYELMFKLQIIIKFISKYNDLTWREITSTTVWQFPRFQPHINKWILRSRMLHTRMRDLINEIHTYLNYDVIGTGFKKFSDVLAATQESLLNSELGSTDDSPSVTGSNAGTGIGTGTGTGTGTNGTGFNSFGRFNNTNDIFTSKIFNSQTQKGRTTSTSVKQLQQQGNLINVSNLKSKLSEYLNGLINDSLITKPELLNRLKSLFDLIISYDHFLTRLKTTIILCNEELFSRYSREYPDKFNDKLMDTESVNGRFSYMNNQLKEYFEAFGDYLTDFIVALREYGESENKSILILTEKLEACFPET